MGFGGFAGINLAPQRQRLPTLWDILQLRIRGGYQPCRASVRFCETALIAVLAGVARTLRAINRRLVVRDLCDLVTC